MAKDMTAAAFDAIAKDISKANMNDTPQHRANCDRQIGRACTLMAKTLAGSAKVAFTDGARMIVEVADGPSSSLQGPLSGEISHSAILDARQWRDLVARVVAIYCQHKRGDAKPVRLTIDREHMRVIVAADETAEQASARSWEPVQHVLATPDSAYTCSIDLDYSLFKSSIPASLKGNVEISIGAMGKHSPIVIIRPSTVADGVMRYASWYFVLAAREYVERGETYNQWATFRDRPAAVAAVAA